MLAAGKKLNPDEIDFTPSRSDIGAGVVFARAAALIPLHRCIVAELNTLLHRYTAIEADPLIKRQLVRDDSAPAAAAIELNLKARFLGKVAPVGKTAAYKRMEVGSLLLLFATIVATPKCADGDGRSG